MILIFCMTLSFQADIRLGSDICIFKMELYSLTVFLLVYGIFFNYYYYFYSGESKKQVLPKGFPWLFR